MGQSMMLEGLNECRSNISPEMMRVGRCLIDHGLNKTHKFINFPCGKITLSDGTIMPDTIKLKGNAGYKDAWVVICDTEKFTYKYFKENGLYVIFVNPNRAWDDTKKVYHLMALGSLAFVDII